MLVDKIINHYNEIGKNEEHRNPIRASSSGKCARALAYSYHGFKGTPMNARGLLVFRLGQLVEQDLVDACSLLGLTDMQKEVSVDIEGTKITGHIDGLFDDMVVDFKSTTSYGMTRAQKNDISYQELAQMTFYLHALGLQKGLLVYYCKQTSHLHEVVVKYDESIWNKIQNRFTSVLNSTKEQLPDREYEPNGKGNLTWVCSYCPHVETCYPEYELSFDSKGKPVLKVRLDDGLTDIEKYGCNPNGDKTEDQF